MNEMLKEKGDPNRRIHAKSNSIGSPGYRTIVTEYVQQASPSQSVQLGIQARYINDMSGLDKDKPFFH